MKPVELLEMKKIVIEIKTLVGKLNRLDNANEKSSPKERSLGYVLDMLRSEEQRLLSGSQFNSLAVRSALQSGGSL